MPQVEERFKCQFKLEALKVSAVAEEFLNGLRLLDIFKDKYKLIHCPSRAIL
jgi:hypothetical protein